MEDVVLEVQNGTIDINLIIDRINKYTQEEILKQEKGTDHGKIS